MRKVFVVGMGRELMGVRGAVKQRHHDPMGVKAGILLELVERGDRIEIDNFVFWDATCMEEIERAPWDIRHM